MDHRFWERKLVRGLIRDLSSALFDTMKNSDLLHELGFSFEMREDADHPLLRVVP